VKTTDPSLRVEFLSLDRLAEIRAAGWCDVLGVTSYGAAAAVDLGAVPGTRLALSALTPGAVPGSPPFEVWRTAGTLRSGRHGRVHYRSSDGVLFGGLSLPESSHATGAERNLALRRAVSDAYAEMFGCLEAAGLQRPLRIWNYLADINRVDDGVERYRVFNEARQQAFRSVGQGVRIDVPAACALGAPTGQPLTMYFIACEQDPGIALENPRQVAAYDYPPEYGVYSPSFARATLANGSTGRMLFISGTASIVGHRTLHVGDVAAQARETLVNVRAVVAEANRVAGAPLYDMRQLLYKVYVRHPGDQDAVAAVLQSEVCPAQPVLYLQADICRADLLVEIEAVGQPVTGAA
jgi:enamine deaminase RidA (YjgF/YER057c/UK114 family)